jgi:hypothetical protein
MGADEPRAHIAPRSIHLGLGIDEMKVLPYLYYF